MEDGVNLVDVLDSFAGCFGLERENVAYVSTPITTGRRYYDWLAASGLSPDAGPSFQTAHAREVIALNQASAHALVLSARASLGKIVVDPTALEVPVWTQEDYHGFWTRLITDYVGTVVFNDGWEYSTGCTLEYAAALRANATLLDAKLSPLPPTVASMNTKNAVARLEEQGHPIAGLVAARHRIEEAIASVDREQSV